MNELTIIGGVARESAGHSSKADRAYKRAAALIVKLKKGHK